MTDIDKRLLIDTVTIRKTTEEKDGWGKPVLSEAVTLSNVRFDRRFGV
ncbi:minor capsid protein 2 [Streptococcus porcinus]|nr:minor capsid protein 2 [Streptococcus porcinus]